jgi:hypothetical protein
MDSLVEPEPEALRKAKRRWANLLRRILEVDPLACPRCGEEMRIVAFITEPRAIDRILAPEPHVDANARRPEDGSRQQTPLLPESIPTDPGDCR